MVLHGMSRRDNMELFFAGDSSGYPTSTPGIVWNGGGNVLISYEHPARERALNEIMKIFLAGNGIKHSLNCVAEFGGDRLLSYALNKDMIDLTIRRERLINTIYKLYYETDIYTRNELKGILMDLFLAGADGGAPTKVASQMAKEGDNVLLSYARSDQKAQVDKIVEGKMNLFLAGNTKGPFIETDQLDLIDDFNLLKSYNVKEEKALVDDIIKKHKEELMELYCVGPEKANIMSVASEELNHNMLFSYLDKSAIDKYKEMVSSYGKLFVDSGAFSAWTQGKVIDVDQYISWINERSDFIDLYGQIDVIPGDRNSGRLPTPEEVKVAAQKTWENYLYMRPKMKKPEGLLYTFHVGEPIEFLKQALEWRDPEGNLIPYIALGGMVGKPVDVRDRFLDQCFDAISKSSNPHVKVHAFGMTDRNLLMKYPITSADSTSWIMTGAVGSIMSDVGTVMVSNQQINDPTHYSHLPKEALKQFEDSIKQYGFTLDELAESRDKRIMHNARFMKKKFSEIEYKPAVKKKKLF